VTALARIFRTEFLDLRIKDGVNVASEEDSLRTSLIRVTGALTAPATLVLPHRAGVGWDVLNLTTGGHALTVKGGWGSSVSVANSNAVRVVTDGDNFRVAGGSAPSGVNAFTMTTSSFVIPTVNANVVVNVADSTWMAADQVLLISGAGYYRVVSKPSSTTATVKNLGWTGAASPGSTITSPKAVVVGGEIGAAGATGPAGADGASTAAGLLGPCTKVNDTNSINGMPIVNANNDPAEENSVPVVVKYTYGNRLGEMTDDDGCAFYAAALDDAVVLRFDSKNPGTNIVPNASWDLNEYAVTQLIGDANDVVTGITDNAKHVFAALSSGTYSGTNVLPIIAIDKATMEVVGRIHVPTPGITGALSLTPLAADDDRVYVGLSGIPGGVYAVDIAAALADFVSSNGAPFSTLAWSRTLANGSPMYLLLSHGDTKLWASTDAVHLYHLTPATGAVVINTDFTDPMDDVGAKLTGMVHVFGSLWVCYFNGVDVSQIIRVETTGMTSTRIDIGAMPVWRCAGGANGKVFVNAWDGGGTVTSSSFAIVDEATNALIDEGIGSEEDCVYDCVRLDRWLDPEEVTTFWLCGISAGATSAGFYVPKDEFGAGAPDVGQTTPLSPLTTFHKLRYIPWIEERTYSLSGTPVTIAPWGHELLLIIGAVTNDTTVTLPQIDDCISATPRVHVKVRSVANGMTLTFQRAGSDQFDGLTEYDVTAPSAFTLRATKDEASPRQWMVF
jgi:hypothetical protein